MNGFENQLDFVVQSAGRVLRQIDMDPLSPAYGCAHLDYWRDKTSDVADMRRQEAALPLAMLYKRPYPGSAWSGDPRLREAVAALLSFWVKNRYPDGSMDEWYKGERAYAAAAFTTHAVARTLMIMEGDLGDELAAGTKSALAATAGWLAGRDDLFKTNHQAVGVGALAFAGRALGDEALTARAKEKLRSIAAVQTDEGWFPEVGSMDVGYTFLAVEFVAMAMDLWGDFGDIGPFVCAFDFACEWIHPDLRTGEEYGVCHNPYVSMIAPLLLAGRSPTAAYLVKKFGEGPAGARMAPPLLADDLRLPRWAFQPLVAYDLWKSRSFDSLEQKPPPLLDAAAADGVFHAAGLARISRPDYSAVMAPAAGGLVRLFDRDGAASFGDHGYAVAGDGASATNIAYDGGAEFTVDEKAIALERPIAPVKRFMPPYWARVALRLACSTAFGSKTARRLIDVVRRRKGTAINQSGANLASASGGWSMSRRAVFNDDGMDITDELRFGGKVPIESISMVISGEDGTMRLEPLAGLAGDTPGTSTRFVVTKTGVTPRGFGRVTISAGD